jgi:hypothetical protein
MSREATRARPSVSQRFLLGIGRYLSHQRATDKLDSMLILFAAFKGLRAPPQTFISIGKAVNGCR